MKMLPKGGWRPLAIALAALLGLEASRASARNVLIFVADGLRYGAVDPRSAPEMASVRREGVDFADSHSVFPTLTTVNAAAIATGRYPGDSGDYANTVFLGEPALPTPLLSLVPFYEDDQVLGAANTRFSGDYLGHTSLLAAASAAGFQTAAIGKLGPTAIQDVTARDGRRSLVIDDATGSPDGLPLPSDVLQAIKRAGLDVAAPDRGLNTDPGTDLMAGVQVANVEQQNWFTRVATDVVLPRFAASQKPFVMVFWSRDPDGTQHNEGDSLNALSPGINGATSLAAVRNADTDLQRLRATLARLHLDADTDVVVVSDHGFSTISKQSATSPAAKGRYPDVPGGFLPPGFLALDLGRALGLAVHEANGLDLTPQGHPKGGSALLGADVKRPEVVVGANGGSDLLWLPHGRRREWASRIIQATTAQDYATAIFAADDLGPLPGALPMSAIQMRGVARTPAPDLLVVFRSGLVKGCSSGAELCTYEVSDTSLQQGQGNHGGLSRADTRNMMAAVGPDFRHRFKDEAPAGNADLAPTIAALLHLDLGGAGRLSGRVLTEALAPATQTPNAHATRVVRSSAAATGFVTVLRQQTLDGRTYTDQLEP